MEVMAIGVFRMSGKSKESGNPYDFSQLLYLKPIEPVARETMQLRGFGYEVSKADLANDSLEKFGHVAFPARIELLTDTIPGRNGFRTIITGFRPVQAAQPKAA